MGKEGIREQQLRELREQRATEIAKLNKLADGLYAFAHKLKQRVAPAKSSSNTPEASGTARKAPSGKAVSAPAPITDPSRSLARASPIKRGPPRIEDRDKTLTATKPWIALGMSRRTWYRREAEKAKAALPRR